MTDSNKELQRINEELAFSIHWKERALDQYRGELNEILIILCGIIEKAETNGRRLENAKQSVNAAIKENKIIISYYEYLKSRTECALDKCTYYENISEGVKDDR